MIEPEREQRLMPGQEGLMAKTLGDRQPSMVGSRRDPGEQAPQRVVKVQGAAIDELHDGAGRQHHLGERSKVEHGVEVEELGRGLAHGKPTRRHGLATTAHRNTERRPGDQAALKRGPDRSEGIADEIGGQIIPKLGLFRAHGAGLEHSWAKG